MPGGGVDVLLQQTCSNTMEPVRLLTFAVTAVCIVLYVLLKILLDRDVGSFHLPSTWMNYKLNNQLYINAQKALRDISFIVNLEREDLGNDRARSTNNTFSNIRDSFRGVKRKDNDKHIHFGYGTLPHKAGRFRGEGKRNKHNHLNYEHLRGTIVKDDGRGLRENKNIENLNKTEIENNTLGHKAENSKENEIAIHTTSHKNESGQVAGSVVGRSHGGYFVSLKELPPPEKDLSDKYIIYKCQLWCGGLGDRERGIVTAYVLSQMLRRKFGIIMNKGCDFSNYVVPNIVNWTVTDGMLKGKSSGHQVNVDTNKLGLKMRDSDLEVMFGKDVMYYQGNVDFVHYLMHKKSYQSLSWTKNQTLYGVYRISFAHLFRLAPHTERKYDTFLRELSSSPLICAHLRMGQSKTLPLDAPRPRKPDLKALTTFLKGKLVKSSKLFLATDCEDTREKMRTLFPSRFIEVQGKIVHIDRYRGTLDCAGMEKAILDQFILTKCDVFVASESGFSWMAAILRGTNDGLFKAVRGNVTRGWKFQF